MSRTLKIFAEMSTDKLIGVKDMSDTNLDIKEEDLNPPSREDLLNPEEDDKMWFRFKEIPEEEDPFLIEANDILTNPGAYTREFIEMNQSVISLYLDGLVEVCYDDNEKGPLIRLTTDGGNIMLAQTLGSLSPIAEA
jgi:hypothetical protein